MVSTLKTSQRDLTSINGDGVHSQRLDVVTISFNDSHPVLVDRENEGRVAGKTNDTETVSKGAIRDSLLNKS